MNTHALTLLSPVIEKAQNYLNNAEPYDHSGLYTVGLLLVYKKFTPNTPVKKTMLIGIGGGS